MEITVQQIKDAFGNAGYCTNDAITYTVYASMLCDKPLLLEGAPGVGKTELGKALAKGLGMEFIRVQLYEGLTADQVMYDFDYQKQLLTLEAVRPLVEEQYKGCTVSEAVKRAVASMDFYGEDFLIRRPVLRAITSDKPCVLLLDEMDKAPEEIEYMLYEFLERYGITIPQYGPVTCQEDRKPFVVITSNGYRDLSGALRRRCAYLYIDPKTEEEVVEILASKAGADIKVATGIARCLKSIREHAVRRPPSIAEAVDFAQFITMNKGNVTRDMVLKSLGLIIKNKKDESTIMRIVSEEGNLIWEGN